MADAVKLPQAFRIRGLDCAEEVAVLKRELGPLVGGEAMLSFDVLNAKMSVSAGVPISTGEVQAAVARTGMQAETWRDEKSALVDDGFWERNRRTVLTVASGALLLAGAGTHAVLSGVRTAFSDEGTLVGLPVVVVALYVLSILAGVWTVLPKAWIALKRLRPDMNLLMVIAAIGAVAIGQWMEAATVAFLFALSLALEAWSVGRARRAVAALLALAPPEVRLLHPDGREETVPPDRVSVGGRFRVRPGDRIPLDGRVVDGSWTGRGASINLPLPARASRFRKRRATRYLPGRSTVRGRLQSNRQSPFRIRRSPGSPAWSGRHSLAGLRPNSGSKRSPGTTPRRSWSSPWPLW